MRPPIPLGTCRVLSPLSPPVQRVPLPGHPGPWSSRPRHPLSLSLCPLGLALSSLVTPPPGKSNVTLLLGVCGVLADFGGPTEEPREGFLGGGPSGNSSRGLVRPPRFGHTPPAALRSARHAAPGWPLCRLLRDTSRRCLSLAVGQSGQRSGARAGGQPRCPGVGGTPSCSHLP